MTKDELMEALSYHGWEKKGKMEMMKTEHRVHIYPSYSGDEYRVYYDGVGIAFHCSLSAIEITGNRMKAEWEGNRVEVWI